MTTSRILSSLTRWPLFSGYCVLLYFLSTLPLDQMPPEMVETNDKLSHFLGYFLLALLSFRTFLGSSLILFHQRVGAKAVVFSLVYALLLEWAQKGVPGRSSSFVDWAADAVGVFFASSFFRISRLPCRGYPDPLK